MAEIRLELDRSESYCLLVATECLRQLFCDGDGGIPLISEISKAHSSQNYAQLDILFEASEFDWVAHVYVNSGDLWPKGGDVRLIQGAVGAGGMIYDFRLEGHPDNPKVHFLRRTA